MMRGCPFFSADSVPYTAGSAADSCSAGSDSADFASCSGCSYRKPPKFVRGEAADIVCPLFQDLSFGLNKKLANSPAKIATVIPPAADLRPPVNIPRKPSFVTASFTPLAKI